MLSIWERNSLIQYDYIIVGSGIVGLCTAHYVKQQFPSARVAVLERGLLPSGASTRNAGFACMGSLSELVEHANEEGMAAMATLFEQRYCGLQRLLSIIPPQHCGYQQAGSHELLFREHLGVLNHLDAFNEKLKPILGKAPFEVASSRLRNMGFAQVEALIENTGEAELDSGLLLRSLITLVQQQGVDIKTGCTVMQFEEKASGVDVVCKAGELEAITFHARKLLLCTNAFTKQLLPEADVVPGRGQVLVTQPIPNLPFQGIFHFEAGYYYFREYQGRVLFGGGRQLDKAGETTTDMALHESIQADLQHKLYTIILPGVDVDIDLRWSGIMAFGAEKKPMVQALSEHIFVGARLSGMGVALGSEVAWQLSQMIRD
ncbi:MAG: NAD(P)/FAD-dependent oxidoreductase [Chitinophagaceae bacterium]